jgi:hypothetical protein
MSRPVFFKYGLRFTKVIYDKNSPHKSLKNDKNSPHKRDKR